MVGSLSLFIRKHYFNVWEEVELLCLGSIYGEHWLLDFHCLQNVILG